MSATHGATRPGRVAFAVVHHDPPEVYIAEDEYVLSRLVALHVVAPTRPESLPSHDAVEELRRCLLEERWADAIFLWVEHSGVVIDAYPDEPVWTEAALDAERGLGRDPHVATVPRVTVAS